MTRVIPAAVFLVLTGNAMSDRYFRDEFYYLACSRHLAWGYVDQPPLSIAALWIVRHIAGDSLLAMRIAAAVVAAGAVWLTGRIAARLGGSSFARVMAMMAAAVAPVLLGTASYYSMNVFDVLLWALAAYVLIDVLERPTIGRASC